MSAATLALATERHRAGRIGEAVALYRAALAAAPGDPDALHGLGLALHQAGDGAGAAAALREALARRPTPEGWSNLGIALRAAGDVEGAVAAFRAAIALRPGLAAPHYNLANALRAAGRLEEAREAYLAAIDRGPASPEAHNNLGTVLHGLGRLDEAAVAFRTAVMLRPGHAEAHNNLAAVLREQGRPGDAARMLEALLARAPGDAGAHYNLGLARHEQGRLDEAAASLERAIALAPGLADARFALALVRLLGGDLAAGWPGYENRWHCQGAAGPRALGVPQWRGEDGIAGRTILLHGEQGFGDALQFVRYAPLVAARGARVLVEVHGALAPLLAGMEGVEAVLRRGDALPAFDLHCPLMSLPLAFGTTLATIPAEVPYLRAPADRARAWRAIVGADGPDARPRVGLAWSGNPAHRNDRNRSIPPARLAAVLEGLPCRPFAIQKDARPGDAAALAAAGIADLRDRIADFADAAAAVEALDLVLTVDTATAHLAGALGRPVIVLLPFVPDWRWQLGRDDSPWYPTARLARQPAPGDWTGALRAARAALERMLAGGGA